MQVLFFILIIYSLLIFPIKNSNELKNYGIKNRPASQILLSKSIDKVYLLKKSSYEYAEHLVPYVKSASKKFNIPENVLLAVLYEEIIHKKPIDITTFGVSQLGLGELEEQDLPPRKDLLEDDELSVWFLAKKLRRLQNQTGSLKTAIILHNGYYDFYESVKNRANDPKLLMLLNENIIVI